MVDVSLSLPVVWTIAASDSGGGAGIQADLKTLFDLHTHGCSVITALTAQNTKGVRHIHITPEDSLREQLAALAEDLPPCAIKIGVLPCAQSIRIVIECLQDIDAHVIYDPVLSATTGSVFLANPETGNSQGALAALFPLIDLLTPNIPEAEQLTGLTIRTREEQVAAADALLLKGAQAVLIKGGHMLNPDDGVSGDSNLCQDYFTNSERSFWLSSRRVSTEHTHGTGCMLSSAIAAFVAQGKALHDAVVLGHAYVHQGIRCATTLGEGRSGCVVQSGWPGDIAHFPQVSLSAQAIDQPSFARCDSLSLGLYPVVDSLEWLERLLYLGVNTIQLRVKDIPEPELDALISQAAALGRHYNARLFINDYWALAIKHNAYGVHLGQEDMVCANIEQIRDAGLRLGVSTHSEYEWCYAATFKPSYLAIGAIFPTDTKEVVEIGLGNLHRWASILKPHYPLVAIGGITLNNINSVLASGVGSIAVVSAITKADDYAAATARLQHMIDKVS